MPPRRGRAAALRLLAATVLVACLPVAGQGLESVVMPGKVIAGHAKLEGQCDNCHKRFDKAAQTRLCLDCHKDVAADAAARKGYHGRSPDASGRECRGCHTDHKGREARIAAFDAAKFDHARADFALRGAHAKPGIECASCHAAGKRWREAPSVCVECHRKDDTHKGALGPGCADCHFDRTWKDPTFDHGKTRFALAGKHAGAACKACHEKGYKDTPRECAACHRKDDAHKGRYGAKCETCHDASNWANHFAHDRATKFPLGGKHRLAKCESCHKGTLYRDKLPLACFGCHKGDDVHKASLGQSCDKCHNDRGWKTASFDHDRDTKFPLRFEHKVAKCDACHKPGVREKLSPACYSCHEKKDGHKGRYGQKCETCHVDRDWKELRFDHDRDTRYRLAGKHRAAKCDSCHLGRLYRDKAPADCIGCHRKDDAHKGQQGERCADCHAETDWKKAAPFDHSKARFPLVGSHVRVPCKSCHLTALFKAAPRECSGCHDKDDAHRGTLGPKCGDCHNARTWPAWDFDHGRRTKYPLQGAHRLVKCASCHTAATTGRVEAATACFGCHRGDDVHGGSFGAQCERCHGPDTWKAIRPGGRVVPARQPRNGG